MFKMNRNILLLSTLVFLVQNILAHNLELIDRNQDIQLESNNTNIDLSENDTIIDFTFKKLESCGIYLNHNYEPSLLTKYISVPIEYLMSKVFRSPIGGFSAAIFFALLLGVVESTALIFNSLYCFLF